MGAMGNTKPKVLVVGSNGYIGSNLSQRLIEKGFDVRLTDLSKKSQINSKAYHQADFSDLSSIEKLVDGIDLIYFFAGKTGNSEEGFNNPQDFISGNEVTLVNLLNVLKDKSSKPKVIFPSTRLLYQGSEQLITENSPLEAKSVYAVNKLACENYLRIYNENFGIDYTIFRISLPYGTFVQQDHVSYGVMSYLINRAREGNALFIFGEGKQKGSFIHIKDLVELLILGGLSNDTVNEVFNIGGPDSLEIGTVVESIGNKFGVDVSHKEWPEVSRKTDQGDLVFDSSRLLNLLDYTYTNSFATWLNQTE